MRVGKRTKLSILLLVFLVSALAFIAMLSVALIVMVGFCRGAIPNTIPNALKILILWPVAGTFAVLLCTTRKELLKCYRENMLYNDNDGSNSSSPSMFKQNKSMSIIWSCDKCGNKGSFLSILDAKVYNVMNTMLEHHARVSPECKHSPAIDIKATSDAYQS